MRLSTVLIVIPIPIVPLLVGTTAGVIILLAGLFLRFLDL